jgi:Xaa-Pro aminopeptidase
MKRTDKLRKSLLEKGIDALLVTSELNQRYLCGYPFTDGLLLITKTRSIMVTDFRYFEEAQKKAFDEFEIVMPDTRFAYITEALQNENVKILGYENETLSCADFKRYSERLAGFEFAPIDSMLETIREIKDQDELEMMAKAQIIADAALAHLLSVIHPNMTEIDVALELEFQMRRGGAENVSFETIAVSGDASALPHGKPRNVKLQKGFLTMDFGALYGGYCSDMTRTVSIGKADAERKRLYDTVLRAQLAGLASIKPGADCADCDKAARDIIDGTAGFEGCFGHSLGHGVGLYIHESPRLSKGGKGTVLVPGHVVTVEPGIYVFGKYGCRIEDMVAVTEDGYRNFASSPKELIELF